MLSLKNNKKSINIEKKRNFKLVEVNGKKVDYGHACIKEKRSPLSAARKLLGSVALKQGLTGNDKLKLQKTIFSIQETTRGSKKYGKITTYIGKYRKYTPEEMKKAHAAGQSFHMKPEVALYKEKEQNKNVKSPILLKGGENKKLYSTNKNNFKKKVNEMHHAIEASQKYKKSKGLHNNNSNTNSNRPTYSNNNYE